MCIGNSEGNLAQHFLLPFHHDFLLSSLTTSSHAAGGILCVPHTHAVKSSQSQAGEDRIENHKVLVLQVGPTELIFALVNIVFSKLLTERLDARNYLRFVLVDKWVPSSSNSVVAMSWSLRDMSGDDVVLRYGVPNQHISSSQREHRYLSRAPKFSYVQHLAEAGFSTATEMSPIRAQVWRTHAVPAQPTKFFSAESTTHVDQRSVAAEVKHISAAASIGASMPSLPSNTAKLRCAFHARSSRKNLWANFHAGLLCLGLQAAAQDFPSGSSPARYFAISPTRLASRPIACKLSVKTLLGDESLASAHRDDASHTFLADGTWLRLQSMSPYSCQARDWRHNALRARCVARPLSVDKSSDMLSPRPTTISPLNDLCEQSTKPEQRSTSLEEVDA